MAAAIVDDDLNDFGTFQLVRPRSVAQPGLVWGGGCKFGNNKQTFSGDKEVRLSQYYE
jgi:hypothetical protein